MPFTYVSVDSVIPRTGPTLGSQDVTIRGFGFNAATGVTFGGSAATNVVIVSNTTITATTPAHSSGTVDVVVLGVDTGFDLYTYTVALDLLPPIPYRVPPVEQINQTIRREWVQWLQAVKQRVEEPVSIGPGQVTGFPLTAVDDTNVTLTLTGTPETALLAAVTATLGWTGKLSAARGGLGPLAITKGDLLYADANNHWATLADVSVGSYLRSGGVGTAPLWSTLTLPNSAATGDLLYGSAADTLSLRTIGNAGDLLAVSGGIPTWTPTSAITVPYTSISSVPTATVLGRNTAGTGAAEALSTLPSAVQDNITRLGTLVTAVVINGSTNLVAGSLFKIATTGLGIWGTTGSVNDLAFFGASGATVAYVPTGTLDFLVENKLGVGLGATAPTEVIMINAATRPGVRFLLAGVFRGYFGVDDNSYFVTPPSGDFIISTGGNIRFGSASGTGEKFCIDNTSGNVSLGLLSQPGAGTNGIIFPDGTAFSSMASNTCGLYGDDVGGTVNLFGINEAGYLSFMTPGGWPTPRNIAPGSFTVPTNCFVRFCDTLELGSGESVTLESGAQLRID